jgi:O-succinylbenzoic acid--CoA ligase
MGKASLMDWTSQTSHWQILKHFSKTELALTRDAQARTSWIKKHVWIASSGTTRREGLRWVGLPKEAFLSAAESLNRHVSATKSEVWFNVLPTTHVGGLTMHSRAYVAGAKLVDLSDRKWNPVEALKVARQTKATFVSLVPTQLFDLVKNELPPPPSLRAAFLGGGALSDDLYLRARAIGWPILTCYGMTETCAQVATSTFEDLASAVKPRMQILSHAQIENRDGRLAIRASSLADFIVHLHPEKGFSLEDPRRDGWFLTEDIGEVENGFVSILGRVQDRVKISGELVSLTRVEEELGRFLEAPFCVLAVFSERRGSDLIAVIAAKSAQKTARAIDQFHRKAQALWRLDHWYLIDELPRSALGKIMKAQLLAHLGL